MLKGRWRALRCLNVRLREGAKEHALAWHVIKAAMVLHNLFIDTANYYEPPEGWDSLPHVEATWEGPLHVEGLPVGPQASVGAFRRREEIAFLTAWHSPQLLPNKKLLTQFPVQQQQVSSRELRTATPGVRAIIRA